jgi:tetratricopeptide (TPR) repeat protein
MTWRAFPYTAHSYCYTRASLKKMWPRLHAGDAEAFPKHEALVEAWIAFHAGEFERAAKLGLAFGTGGHSVANKATCIYANYLEQSQDKKLKLYQEVVTRCEQQQEKGSQDASAYYWHAYALGRYAQGISIITALSEGIGTKVRKSLDITIKLTPKHADAHIAYGVYHAEIIDKVGAVLGRLTYGASKDESVKMFKQAISLNPDSAIARIEYANGLMLLDGTKKMSAILALYREAAGLEAMDAMERLDIQMAIEALEAIENA